MNEQQQEELFLSKIREELDTGVENLGDEICSHLAKSRAAALKLQTRPRAYGLRLLRLAFACLILAAFIWIIVAILPPGRNVIAPEVTIEDLEMVTSGENPDFYRDVDFYLWLSKKKSLSRHGAGTIGLLSECCPPDSKDLSHIHSVTMKDCEEYE